MILAFLLTVLAVASWATDFSWVAEFCWFVELPHGSPADLLFGAGICTGFTLAASVAWLAVLAGEIAG